MATQKSYSHYVDSGIVSIGKIPEGWDVKRLKFLTRINSDVLPESTPSEFTFKYIDISNVEQGRIADDLTEYSFSEAPSRARRRVRAGDTIIGTVRTYLKAIARVTEDMTDTIVSTGFAVVRPVQLDAGFQYYQCLSESFVQAVVAASTGVSYPAINPSELGGLPVLQPSIAEQKKIALFLDERTASLDSAIEKKRQLIGLLQGKRDTVISQAVTKGIDPNAEMVESGVESIGKIPKGWIVKRLKYVTYINSDVLPETTPGEFVFKYIDISNVEQGQIADDLAEYTFSDAPSRARRRVRVGDTVIGTVRTYLKAIAQISEDMASAVVSTGFAVLRPHLLDAGYQYYQCLSTGFVQAVVAASTGVSYPAINPSELGGLSVLQPPLAEQQSIAKRLDGETRSIDGAIRQINKSIDLLIEYKSSLIYNAVTGKIKV